MNEKQFIVKARDNEYSDEEIWEYLSLSNPSTVKSLQSGYRPGELKKYYGLDLTGRDTAEEERQKILKKLEPISKYLKAMPGKAALPFKKTGKVYAEERKAGEEAMGEAIRDPSLKSLYQLPLGFLQYGLSPLTGAAKGFVKTSFEEPLKEVVSPEAAEFISSFPEEATYFVPGGHIAKYAGLTKQVPKVIKASRAAFLKKPWEMELYRGIGKGPSGKKFVSDPGDLGRGIYYSTNEAAAKAYGTVTKQRVQLKNPLILNSEDAYALADKYHTINLGKDWYKKMRGKFADEKNISKESDLQRMRNAQKLTNDLLKQGYDGLVALFPNGEAEVVKFSKEVLKTGRKLEQLLPKAFQDRIGLSKDFSNETVKKIAKEAEKSLKTKFTPDVKISHQIADAIEAGEISGIEEVNRLAQTYKLTQAQTGDLLQRVVSRGARNMAYMSKVKQQLMKTYAGDPQTLGMIEDIFTKTEPANAFFRFWNTIDQPRRALLVSQLATATRNAWSQIGRANIGAWDNVLQEYVSGGTTKESIQAGFHTYQSLFRNKKLNEMLASKAGALAKARMFNQPVHEVVGGKIINRYVMFLNKTQEFYFRRLAFEAKMRQLLKKEGLDFSTINPERIPSKTYEQAVDYCLEMTFAASAKTKRAQEFIRAWSTSPLTTINPFPRFAFANALPFIFEHSPLGYLKAFSPKTLEALASGHPERFAKAASRATLGTLMLESAWHVRQSDRAGDKWYHIKVGEPDEKGNQRMIDVRAYAPLSTYLFIAEAFIHPERLKGKDWAEAAIGLNRIAGSGLVLVDLLRAKKIESVKDIGGRLVGAYIGSYTVPGKTVKDILAGTVSPEEAVYKEKRISPVIAPALENLPYAGRVLPEAISPITTRRVKAEKPLKKQFFGLTETIRTPIMREIDKTALGWSSIFPSTGVKEANYEMTKYMGPLVEKFAPSIILTNPGYNEGSVVKKRLILKGFFKLIRQAAKAQLETYNPTLAAKVSVERISDDEKKYIEETTGVKVDKLF